MTTGAKLWKVWRIESGVACLETVVSFRDRQKKKLPNRSLGSPPLFGLTAHADAEHSSRQAELSLPQNQRLTSISASLSW